jgi:AhpD family alkylhydroperoxidase
MPARLKYGQLAPEGFAKMTALEHYLNTSSGLEPVLLDIVRLRASQMNGCEYCIGLHAGELRKLGETEERITAVLEWWKTALFTERERAALAWTEAVTNIQDGHAPDEVYAALRAQFTEVEVANLTLTVTTINAWNRIAISLGNFAGHSGPIAGKSGNGSAQ